MASNCYNLQSFCMCDKYIFYIYTCLRWGKLHLSEEERSSLFGNRCDVFAQLDPKWLVKFVVRCRVIYQGKLQSYLSFSPLRISNEVYRVRTDGATFTTVDGRGRVVQIENFLDPCLPRKLSVGDEAFAVFQDTLAVFSGMAFRIQVSGKRQIGRASCRERV